VFGFWLGTASLVMLVGVVAGGRRRHLGSGCHERRGWRHREWHGHPGMGGPRSERRMAGFSLAMAEVVKRRLRIDEEQEPVVDHAVRDLRETWTAVESELHAARTDLAGLFAAEVVDDVAVDAVFARLDEAMKKARREAVSAGKQVHAVLEPEQRSVAADLMARPGAGWWR
jgi:Spy/CpxP family protein refolding chaperone